MRSIGKVNIKKLNKIVEEEFNKKDLFGFNAHGSHLKANIEARIPEALKQIEKLFNKNKK